MKIRKFKSILIFLTIFAGFFLLGKIFPNYAGGIALYDFNSGGPLICSGDAPNIICDDTGSSKWDGFNYDPSTGKYVQDSNSNITIRQYPGDPTHGPDYGWSEVDNTVGAAGTIGSLKVRITGTTGNGGDIQRKSTELNYPSRVGTGIGGNMYLDFHTNGYHRPELLGKKRISAYIKIPTNWMLYDSYGGPAEYNMHIGTYVCSQADEPCNYRTGCNPYSPGEPCDGTGGHYYHHYTFGQFGGGGWAKVILDQNPQFRRYGEPMSYNPTQERWGEDYIPSLTRMYFDVTGGTNMAINTPITLWVDQVEAYDNTAYGEPDQNEISIASAIVGYYPENDGHWEISWSSGVSGLYTFQIKYSLTPFTNANYATNGATITPLIYAASGGSGLVGKFRSEDYGFPRYATKFTLPSNYTTAGATVYFAIKDVSVTGQHGVPGVSGADKQTSTDNRIYTFDYQISGPADTIPPASPTGLAVT